MNATGSALDYEHPSKPQRRMLLKETDAGVTLIFPVVHPAIGFATACVSLVYAAMAAFGLSFILRLMFESKMVAVSADWIKIILMYGASVLFWSLVAAYEIIWFRKISRVPVRLGFDETELFRQWPTWRGMRESRWTLEEIVELRCEPVRSIIPRHVTIELLIRLRCRRWPLRSRFNGYKVPLARRFADRLQEARQARSRVTSM